MQGRPHATQRYAYQIFLVLAVVLGVMTARLGMMFFSVAGMAMRGVGVVRSLLVVAGFVMPRSFAMMLRGMLVMFGRLVVMLNACVIAHGALPVGG